MIYVDIYVAAMFDRFEFRCDETVLIEKIIERIYQLLIKKTKTAEEYSSKTFWLCSVNQKTILSPCMTLKECGIINGDQLIFL